MKYNQDKVDEMQLALLYLTTFKDGPNIRAWKSMAWDIADRLFEKGYIFDPKSKTKSVVLTEEGAALSEKLFKQNFETQKTD